MTGNVTVNGITDQDLVRILEIKVRNEGYLGFNPQQIQPQQVQGTRPYIVYNNVVLSWMGDPGIKAVQEILSALADKDAKAQAKAAGQ